MMKFNQFYKTTVRHVSLISASVLMMAMAVTSVSAATLNTDWECNSSEFHFIVTDDPNDPRSISVTFDKDGVSGGDTATVPIPLEKVTGNAAHYTVAVGNGVGITWSPISTTYSGPGKIRVSHGPCPPVVPEVPMAAIYPALGAVTFVAGYGIRRLRQRGDRSVLSV